MNHNSSLGQNLASGGGLLPVCGLFVILSAGPDFAQQWARVGINSITGLVMFLLCVAILGLIRDPKCGHRWMHGYMLLAVAGIGAVKWWLAWKYMVGSDAHLPLWVSALQDTFLVGFGVYFYTTRHDLHITYQRSEEKRRANLHAIENLRQAAVLLGYRVRNTAPSHLPMELTTDVGRSR